MKLRGMKLIFFLKEPLGSSIFLKVVAKSKTLVAKKKKTKSRVFFKNEKIVLFCQFEELHPPEL